MSSLALGEAPRIVFVGCFPKMQGHKLGRATSLALAEVPIILLCRLFPYSAAP